MLPFFPAISDRFTQTLKSIHHSLTFFSLFLLSLHSITSLPAPTSVSIFPLLSIQPLYCLFPSLLLLLFLSSQSSCVPVCMHLLTPHLMLWICGAKKPNVEVSQSVSLSSSQSNIFQPADAVDAVNILSQLRVQSACQSCSVFYCWFLVFGAW